MKPREFDELVRQKFDQNDFAYNPGNWEKMAGELEGQNKKRSLIVWWLPLVGIAAAVTVSLGFASYMHNAIPANGRTTTSPIASIIRNETKTTTIVNSIQKSTVNKKNTNNAHCSNKNVIEKVTSKLASNIEFGIKLENALSAPKNINYRKSIISGTSAAINDLLVDAEQPHTKKIKKLPPVELPVCKTFKEPVDPKMQKSWVILSGGFNYGNKTSGFMFGATGRTMVSARVYVEGDIAFMGSSNTQKTASLVENGNNAATFGASSTNRTSSDGVNNPAKQQSSVSVSDKAYNQYYAQVTPTIGYKLHRKVSVGIGPDFQQSLNDNRPVAATLDKGNVQVAPMFDVGFIGKTEIALSEKLKAGIYYREGINNVITPMNKYIERNYLQFQLKYTVFNKAKGSKQ